MDGISKIRNSRPDLSPFLFHFTKGVQAEAVMNQILEQQKLKSSLGYICFTETPLTSMIPLLDYFEDFPRPMYSKYAIGFNRNILVKDYAAQPVMYGVKGDVHLMPESLKWKYLELDITNHQDFSWLREWRIKGDEFDFSNFPKDNIIVIAPNNDALKRLSTEEDFDVEFEYEHEIRESLPYLRYFYSRKWIGFSIDDLRKEQALNDFILSGMTLSQKIGEEL